MRSKKRFKRYNSRYRFLKDGRSIVTAILREYPEQVRRNASYNKFKNSKRDFNRLYNYFCNCYKFIDVNKKQFKSIINTILFYYIIDLLMYGEVDLGVFNIKISIVRPRKTSLSNIKLGITKPYIIPRIRFKKNFLNNIENILEYYNIDILSDVINLGVDYDEEKEKKSK